jgi:hypothetical protein
MTGHDAQSGPVRPPVPEDLDELWNWHEAGHWPSGFASEPGDVPGDRSGKDLVFPRRLLVY